jgi:predicted nucleic acid-binding protein
MLKVFLDINILLDYLIEERPGNKAATEILKLVVDDALICYTCPISLLNIYYILRNQKTEQERKDIIESFLDIFNIVELDIDVLKLGLYASVTDYEDAIQYISAKKINADFIITGDKGFIGYDLDLKRVSPVEFLEII